MRGVVYPRMRKLLAAAAALALSMAPASSGDPGPGYLDATANVSYLGTIPLDADTAGARLLGRTFYVLTAKGLTIYDVSTPELPVPMGFIALPHTPNQEREDVDTNGKILIAGQSYLGILYVVDVSNPHLPVLLSTLEGVAGHTNTCVLSCTWVYTSDGDIVDLRDPRNPKAAGHWTTYSGTGDGHDLTEIRPGLVMGATSPVVYLDARKNPAKPKRIGVGAVPDNRYIHGNLWPRAGKDRWLLVGSESGMTCGTPKNGSMMVYDTKRFAKTGKFDYMGDYSLAKGLPTDGRAQVNQHCGHWFQPHPSFKDGGLVAVAWYGFGTRFVEVTKAGKIVERGWFLGGGQASSAYWISKDVVYSLDYVRGIDIVKFDPKKKPGRPMGGQWNPRSPFATLSEQPPARNGKPYVCPIPGAGLPPVA